MKNNLKNGFISNLPISISVLIYGVVLGVICTSKSITFIQLALMNIFIFAGSSQFVIVDMINNPINISIVVGSALLINLRYFLITASLNDLFVRSSINKKLFIVHFVTDESWAVTLNKKKENENINIYFLLGGGFCIFVSWFIGTSIGYYFGALISNPKLYGLDFAFLALFISIVASMYKKRSDLIVYCTTAIIAVILEKTISNMSYIIFSSLIGCYIYIFINKREKYE
ncbi:branched-chain amino acid permease [Malaciobacter molluscorum LMG 25693]|uniref:Branched-chain amino acid permease n=1 Tax=Malaciobacter molluscorum LMG 25693 TaxID=870501 RepID=A0A2G1DF03_9BACT|nr:AzlC family ABC transporter permease [Malaciobacter molluscorum]AXX91254.1 branched-chain amino acid transport protein, AzlC family [Malaciobacter molluscorum LMG 25693]PHO17069.1 branched-chain amino acid permease [Malaciobacter molluscorum LMG 25693]